MPPKRQSTIPSRASSQRSRTAVAQSTAESNAASATPNDLATQMAEQLTITKSKVKDKATIVATALLTNSRPVARTRSRKVASADIDAETLADTMKQKLALASQPILETRSKEDDCAEAMRSVNIASRALSGIVESGWKYEPPSNSKKPAKSALNDTMSLIHRHVESIRNGLTTLRELRPGDLDVERAASSAAGKLVSLETVGSWSFLFVHRVFLPFFSINLQSPFSPTCNHNCVISANRPAPVVLQVWCKRRMYLEDLTCFLYLSQILPHLQSTMLR